MSGAAVRAVAARGPSVCVLTQGHVLTVHELPRTLVLEATVHHLDVLLELPDPAPAEVVAALEVFSELAGVPLPADDAQRWLLLAAGRLPLTSADRAVLGSAAERFPLLA